MAQRKITILTIGLAFALGFLLYSPTGLPQDTDQETTPPFDVTVQNTVKIDLFTTPGNKTITRTDLLSRYFALDDVVMDVYAVTNYQVTVCKDTTQSTGPVTSIAEDRIMETRVQNGATGFNPFPDDGADDPTSDISNFNIGQAGDDSAPDAPDIPEGCASPKNLFHGGNTEGGTDNKFRVTQNLQLDLDALLDNAAGNVYQFTITLTIDET